MKVDLQRTVDMRIGPAICRILSMLDRLRLRRPADDEPKQILVILLSEMGSLLLARRMFDHLRAEHPGAEIHALVFSQNREVLDLQGIVPERNVLTLRNDTFLHLIGDTLRTVRRLRALRIDTVIDCELFARFSAILSYMSGARVRVGFDPLTQEGLSRGRIVNRPVAYNPYQHISEQFVSLASAIPSGGVPGCKRVVAERPAPLPPLAVSPGEVDAVRERLLTDFPALAGKRLILLSPAGGLLPIRALPLDVYAEIADALMDRGHAVGIIGLKRDRDVAQSLIGRLAHEGAVDLTGWTRSVREVMLLFHHAALLIANDGGPGHFAAMTPMPAIVLFGPETPVLYGTLDEKSINLRANVACSPCLTAYNHRDSACDGDNACLKAFAAADVLAHADAMLAP